jgi:hypothetical protein
VDKVVQSKESKNQMYFWLVNSDQDPSL